MLDIYFDSFDRIVKRYLEQAERHVRIAVAWINFRMFEDSFSALLRKGVALEIVVDAGPLNQRYHTDIQALEDKGASVTFCAMPHKRAIMHNKFCVIDGAWALAGSYNWTQNATANNYESLTVTDDSRVIGKFLEEFEHLKQPARPVQIEPIFPVPQTGGSLLNVYFRNFEEVIKTRLKSARKRVRIAVAWLNFGLFFEDFAGLLSRGVRLEIVISYQRLNLRADNMERIKALKKMGATVKLLAMPTARMFMHHKFCLIDGALALEGSCNWTQNGLYRNAEFLMETNSPLLIEKLRFEFKNLKKSEKSYVQYLQQRSCCEDCHEPILNFCILEEAEPSITDVVYHTQVSVYARCDCSTKKISELFVDRSLFDSLMSIGDRYDDDFYPAGWEELQELLSAEIPDRDGAYLTGEEKQQWIQFDTAKYLHSLDGSLSDYQIHAVGVEGSRWYGRHDEEFCVAILWKNRFRASEIENEYDRDEFYHLY